MAYDGTLKFDTKIDPSGFQSGINEIQNSAEQGLSGVGATLNHTADAMASIGSTLSKKVTLPIVGVGTAAIKTTADFDAAMAEVQAISGASGKELGDLRDMAKEMGRTTKFSASESAEAFKYMAMAGWDTDDMLNSISGVMNLAAASGEDLGSVSDIVTDSMTAFGMEADKTSTVIKDGVAKEVSNCSRFVDVLAAASNKSNTNVAMLGESFKYVAPVAGAMGYSVEDTAVALGLMANSGIKASQSGTALRTLLVNMAKPTEKMATAMDILGLNLENSDGSAKSLMEVMQDLRKGFGEGTMDAEEFSQEMAKLQQMLDDGTLSQEGYEDAVQDLTTAMYGAEGAEKARLAAMLAGKEGMAGLLAIVNTGEDDFNDLSEAIYNSNGTAEEMSRIMNDNLQGDIYTLKSAVEALMISLGEVMMPIARKVVQVITDIVNWLNSLSDGTKRTIVVIAAVAAAVGPLLIAGAKIIKLFTTVGGAFKTITGAVKGVSTAVSGVSSSFGGLSGVLSAIGGAITPAAVGIAAAIAVVVAAVVDLWKTSEPFRDAVIGAFEKVKESLTGALKKIKDAVAPLWEAIKNLGSSFYDLYEGSGLKSLVELLASLAATLIGTGLSVLIDTLGSALAGLAQVLTGAVEIISGVLDVIVGLVTLDFDRVKKGFEGIGQGIKDIFQGLIERFVGAAVDIAKGLYQGLQDVASVVGDWLSEHFGSVVEGISQFIANAVGKIAELPGKIGEFLASAVTAVGEWISNMAGKALEFGAAFIDKIVGFFTGLPEKIGSFLNSVVEKAGAWISGMVGKAAEFGFGFIDKIVEFFTGLPETIWGFLTSVIEKAGEWVSQMIQKAAEAGSGFFDKVVAFFSDLPYKAGYFLGTLVGTVASWISDMVVKAAEFGVAFADKVVEFFTQLPEKIWGFLVNVVSKVAEWTTQMVQKATEAGTDFLNKVVEFFTQLPGKVWEFLSGTVSKAGEWASQMVQKVAEMGTNFINKVVEFFTQLPEKVWEFFSGAVEKAAQWVQEMAARAAEAGSEFLGKVSEFFIQLPEKIWEFLSGAFAKVSDWSVQMAQKALETGKAFLDNILNFITELPGKIQGFLTDVVNGVVQWASQLWEKGSAAAKSLFDAVVNGVKELPGKMLETGKAIIDGVWDGICNAKDAFVKNVKDFFRGVVDGVKDSLGIHSPSKVMREEVGQPIASGVAEGISDKQGDAVSSMEHLADGLMVLAKQMTKGMDAESTAAMEAMAGNLNQMLSTIPQIMNNLVTAAMKALSQLSDQMGKTANQAAGSFSASMTKGIAATQSAMVSSGKNLVQGLWQGISGASGWLYKSVSQFASGIVKNIKSTLGIHSPSRLMEDEVGKWLPPGIGEGFSDAMPGLEKQVDAEMAALAGKLKAAVDLETRAFLVNSGETAQHKAVMEYPKGGDTYVEEKIEQTNNYHVPVATPSEVNKANREAARKLLGGVT